MIIIFMDEYLKLNKLYKNNRIIVFKKYDENKIIKNKYFQYLKCLYNYYIYAKNTDKYIYDYIKNIKNRNELKKCKTIINEFFWIEGLTYDINLFYNLLIYFRTKNYKYKTKYYNKRNYYIFKNGIKQISLFKFELKYLLHLKKHNDDIPYTKYEKNHKKYIIYVILNMS